MAEVIKVEDCGENIGDYDIPIHNAIIIPKEATNGDVIKTMFPNAEYGKDELGNMFVISSAQLGYIAFRECWWNAPYGKERED